MSTIYNPLNQYKVVMEAAPQYWQSPDQLKDVYVQSTNGGTVPLSSFARYETTNTALRVNHQGQFVASTISFNLPEDVSLSQATAAIDNAMSRHRRAGVDPRQLPGHREGVPGLAATASRC